MMNTQEEVESARSNLVLYLHSVLGDGDSMEVEVEVTRDDYHTFEVEDAEVVDEEILVHFTGVPFAVKVVPL